MQEVYAVNLGGLSGTFSQFNTFGDFVNMIVMNAAVLAGIICFFLLVFGGLSVIMGSGSGNTDQVEKGQKAITGAVIGLIIVVAAVWIIQLLEIITGQKLLSLPTIN